MAVPPIYVDKSTSGPMRFLRISIGNCMICSDWKCNGLLPLVVLAVSRPEKALQWLLLNSLDIPFVESVKRNWKNWIQQLENENNFFLTGQPSTTSFAITYTGMVTLRRDILVVVCLFMTHHFYCSQDCIQECTWAHIRWMLPLVVLAWETFWETTLANQTKVLVVRNQKSIWDAIRSTPGASPPHLGGRTGRDE